MDAIELAVKAAMAMLDRHGGLWGSDAIEVQDQLTVIMVAVAELHDDYPDGDDAAREILLRLHREDAPSPLGFV